MTDGHARQLSGWEAVYVSVAFVLGLLALGVAWSVVAPWVSGWRHLVRRHRYRGLYAGFLCTPGCVVFGRWMPVAPGAMLMVGASSEGLYLCLSGFLFPGVPCEVLIPWRVVTNMEWGFRVDGRAFWIVLTPTLTARLERWRPRAETPH